MIIIMGINQTKYEMLINNAEINWYLGETEKAIEYYKLALNEKQFGKITKKNIRDNIKELSQA